LEEAHLLKGYLETEGIEAFVLGEHMASLKWIGLGGAGGAVRVQVRAEHSRAALDLMDRYDEEMDEVPSQEGLVISEQVVGEALADDLDVDADGPICPRCSSDLVYPEELPGWRLLFSFLLLGLPLLLGKKRWECRSCRHVWEAGSGE